MKFDELYQLKANNWQLPEKPVKKVMFFCFFFSAFSRVAVKLINN